jgi:hypothetical protein
MTDIKEIKYRNLNKNSLIVYCEKDKHENFMKTVNGNWNGTAWVVPKKKEKEIKEFILENIATHVKSRKNQNKYHREISDDEAESSDGDNDDSAEDSDDLSCIDSSEDEKESKKKPVEKKVSKKSEDTSNKVSTKTDKYLKNDPMLYYKSFKTKPNDFKKINDISSEEESEDSLSSSSDESTSSEDSFPEPKTPKKRKKYYNKKDDSYDDLVDTVKSLQRKVYEIEIENRKLKSKI